MLHSATSEAQNDGENAAFTPDSPQESPEVPQTTTEATKQFPLRLPVAVIIDIENEVKARCLRGEILENAIYCRHVLKNHRKAYNYDADMDKVRRENAALTSRILELQLREDNAVNDGFSLPVQNEERRALLAMQEAVKNAAIDFSKEGFYSPDYYENVVLHYFKAILPQIPA